MQILNKIFEIFFTWSALYFSAVILTQFFLYNLPFMAARELQPTREDNLPIRKQVAISSIYLLVSGLLGALFYFSALKGWFVIYTDFEKYGFWYAIFSIVFYLLCFDLYFYLTHRLLHTEFFYKKIHHVHHQVKKPTVASIFCLHPAEAGNFFLFQFVMCKIVPFHPVVLLVSHLVVHQGNIVGHFGYEIIPVWLQRLFPRLSTSGFHDFHHEDQHCNYGFFFKFWDEIFKTSRQS
jgi:sterol desaturase/sphingolipid hydroxylase (fatty acid hydroxylase superfamily)